MEGFVGRGAERIWETFEDISGGDMTNVFRCIVEDESASDVVSMGMAIDKMRDGLIGYTLYCGLEAISQSRRVVDQDNAVGANKKYGLVATIGDEVSAASEVFEIVALFRVDGDV